MNAFENDAYPLVVRSSIEDSVRFYNNGIQGWCTGMTVDDAIAHRINDNISDLDVISETIQVLINNLDMIDDGESTALLQAIYNHPDKDRFRMVWDGSYLSHAIRIIPNTRTRKMMVWADVSWREPLLEELYHKMENLAPEAKVQMLLDHFDVVYILTPQMKDRWDIERRIRAAIRMDRYF
jgi:hypothetical protein